jgi:hypothetical protein
MILPPHFHFERDIRIPGCSSRPMFIRFERHEDAPLVSTRWVRYKVNPFSANFNFSSQRPHTIHPSRGSSALFFPGWVQGSGQGPGLPDRKPETADCGLPIRFSKTPVPPW